jgi:sarcosine oxidase subunit gamma
MSEQGSRRESPLVRFGLAARADVEIANARVICAERPFLGHINLRGDAHDAQFVAAVVRIVGAPVPTTPNTVARGDDNVVYWLGPDEWLIVTPTEREGVIARELRAGLADLFVAVTEISGGQTVIALRGDAVRELLAKGCPLDLHARVFGVDRCAQSHLAKAPILVRQVDEAPSFEIVVRRSFADYLWTWLEDAASEYGLAIEVPANEPVSSRRAHDDAERSLAFGNPAA